MDLSAWFTLGASLKIPSDSYLVFCGSDAFQVSEDRSIIWDDTCDNAIVVDFSLVSPMIDQIIICAAICKYPNDRNRDKRTVSLGMIDDCHIRVLDAESDEELARWPLPQTSGGKDGVVFGRLVRVGSVWELEAIECVRWKLGSSGRPPYLIPVRMPREGVQTRAVVGRGYGPRDTTPGLLKGA